MRILLLTLLLSSCVSITGDNNTVSIPLEPDLAIINVDEDDDE